MAWRNAAQLAALRRRSGGQWHAGREGSLSTQASYSKLIAGLARQSDWQSAVSIFYSLPEVGIPHSAGICSALLSAYSRKSLWQHALAFLEEGNDLDTGVCNICITACGRASRWSWSLWLLHQLQAGAYEAAPNRISVNAAIHACERRGKWLQALQLLEGMASLSGFSPDAASLNSAMSACEKGQQWELAVALMASFNGDGRTLITYGALSAACAVGQAWEGALQGLRELQAQGLQPSKELFNSLTETCRRGSAWQHALALLELNRPMRLEPTELQKASVRRVLEAAGVCMASHATEGGAMDTLRQAEFTPGRFWWTGNQPVAIISEEWAQRANDLASVCARHSLERRRGFGSPGFGRPGFPMRGP